MPKITYIFVDFCQIKQVLVELHASFPNATKSIQYIQIDKEAHNYFSDKKQRHSSIPRRMFEGFLGGEFNTFSDISSPKSYHVLVIDIAVKKIDDRFYNVISSCGGVKTKKRASWFLDRAKAIFNISYDLETLLVQLEDFHEQRQSPMGDWFD